MKRCKTVHLLFVAVLVVVFCIFGNFQTIRRYCSNRLAHEEKLKLYNDYLERVGADKLQKSRQRLPNAIIIGAEKCGTGALSWFFTTHPLVKAPRIMEMFFFNKPDFKNNLEQYINSMPPVKDYEILIEKTPAYFTTRGTAERIYKAIPDVKIILLLCNPVNRTYSDFIQHIIRKEIGERENFDELVESYISNYNRVYRNLQESVRSKIIRSAIEMSHILYHGIYYHFVKDWLDIWEINKNLIILDGEEFLLEPWKTFTKLQDFLEIPKLLTEKDFEQIKSGYYCIRPWVPELQNTQKICMDKSKGRSRHAEHKWNHEMLKKFFAPENDELFSLIGQRFNWNS